MSWQSMSSLRAVFRSLKDNSSDSSPFLPKTTNRICWGAAKSYLVFGDVDGFGEAKEKIEALDGETLRTVAEEIFTGMSALIYK